MTSERAAEIYRTHYEANKARIDAKRSAMKVASEIAIESRRISRSAAGCVSGI